LEFEWETIQSEMPGANPRELAQIRQGPAYAPIRQQIENLSQKWGFPPTDFLAHRKFSISQWAKESDLAFLYKSRYAELSKYSHAVTASFLAQSMPSFVLAFVTLCLVEASKKVAIRFSTQVPKPHRESIEKLESAFRSYHKSGEYLKLFAKDLLGLKTPQPKKLTEKFKNN